VIQGSFVGGRPRIPVIAACLTAIQPRIPASPPVQVPVSPALGRRHRLPQPILPHARAVQPQAVRLIHSHVRGPVVQRVGDGEALQLPASLANFGGAVGQPLPDSVRQKMESFFGTSFADVRVHVGSQPASIGALAFTHGANLYFAPGQYNPHTTQGQRLLGHELAHVVQQRAGRAKNPFGTGVAVLQDRSLEAEADRMGMRAATRSKPVQPAMVPVPGPIQRTAYQSAVGPRQDFARNAIVQRVKAKGEYTLTKATNLRADGKGYGVIRKLVVGETVEVIDPGGRVSRFKAGLVTNEHSWVRTQRGDEGWINDNRLPGNPRPVSLPPASSVSSTLTLPMSTTSSSRSDRATLSTTVAAPPAPAVRPRGLSQLGTYFIPEVAPEAHKMIGGGDAAMENLKKDIHYSHWRVQVIGGLLCNNKGQRITGEGAWVLSDTGQLYGSQATEDHVPLSAEMFTYVNMQSHEMACQQGVSWAGELKVKEGRVVAINNQSGTFHLRAHSNVNILTYLVNNNVIVADLAALRAQIEIKAWTQTGMDRAGRLDVWENFFGPRDRPPREQPIARPPQQHRRTNRVGASIPVTIPTTTTTTTRTSRTTTTPEGGVFGMDDQ
jgi:hypothetical protein